jgi:hypothetical protein
MKMLQIQDNGHGIRVSVPHRSWRRVVAMLNCTPVIITSQHSIELTLIRMSNSM